MEFDGAGLVARLAATVEGEIRINEVLAPYTSYRIGGPAAIWVAPRTEAAVHQALEIIHRFRAPLFVLGRGTNLLISDHGWPGVVLYLAENLSGWHFEETQAIVLAGTRLNEVIQAAVARGLAGMEMMSGIPGGVGGALRMNAGAFGQQMSDVTASVRGFYPDGSRFEVENTEIHFGYRRVPELEEMIITSCRLRFHPQDAAVLKKRVEEVLNLRAKKQPLEFPSCGSVFKRPAGYYAGVLIEEAGLKGERVGGARVSRKHAGFILNTDNASAADVYALIRRIEKRVFQRFGIRLQREVRLIGDFGSGPF